MAPDIPVLTVLDAAAWSRWLASAGRSSSGVWLTLAKKNVSKPTSLTYAAALDEALCHGWIDGQRRGGDDKTFSQRFTPRTTKSTWSQRNVAHIARLEAQGRIQEQGQLAINAAKADGRWDAAYAGSADAELPREFLEAVAAVPAAQRALDEISKQERYAIYHRLVMLKTAAGREKRIAAFVEALAGEGEDEDDAVPAAVPKKLAKAPPNPQEKVLKKAKKEGSQEGQTRKRKASTALAAEVPGSRRSSRLAAGSGNFA
ncbi:uncharacterized protein B0I36DRAFT_326989 [Microdochium trichocladiopsis]|uniref:OmdA domain containing protein n=1 Tax=Microdochium trichocladiopsis TaxID=1682393 RepID=A0A9P8Y4D0_9PEZI|nr:uncharacterized protein B0I36DRAFT_326989 [Microdochium trichocladiopsis]KAH7027380.1 hypothetical protein B0I36DRAFT_326989 [Microdochium trichocladiopsis]